MVDKKKIFSVPEGYFDSLEMRLSLTPSKAGASRSRAGIKSRFISAPVLALAVCCAALAVVSVTFLRNRNVSSDALLATAECYYAADLIPHTDPYMIYDDQNVAETVSEDDIVDYLIEDGVSVAQLEQLFK